jgi:hypothetical protein
MAKPNIKLKLDDKNVLILSIALAVLALVGGVTFLLSQWEYYEEGQGIIIIAYAISCLLLFFVVRFAKIILIIIVLALMGSIMYYAQMKFDWRKAYIQDATNGRHFIMEPYIKEYPLYEEHALGSLWGTQQWVAFAEDCVRPGSRNHATPAVCRSNYSIQDKYNIDPVSLINTEYKKMKRTAERIEQGKMKNKREYQRCLNNKTCSIIPLLPANVDPNSIDRQSQDHLLTRRMFWSLINDQNISPEICEFMDLCRAMRNTGVMPIEKPDSIEMIKSIYATDK